MISRFFLSDQDRSIDHVYSDVGHESESVALFKTVLVAVQAFDITGDRQGSEMTKGHFTFSVSRQISIGRQSSA
ncbi:hypothetical protein A6B37_25310 [Achromobacter sp. HZ01]|nr:hypothetical protein A6B37_25310 [Achromobacter sp. HZ01]